MHIFLFLTLFFVSLNSHATQPTKVLECKNSQSIYSLEFYSKESGQADAYLSVETHGMVGKNYSCKKIESSIFKMKTNLVCINEDRGEHPILISFDSSNRNATVNSGEKDSSVICTEL